MENQFPAGGRSRSRQRHHAMDPDYVETFAASSGATLAWLAGHGIRFEQVPARFLTLPTTRRAPVGGGLALVEEVAVPGALGLISEAASGAAEPVCLLIGVAV